MGSGTAAVVYAVVTAVLFRTLLPDLPTHLFSDLGDPLLNAAILAWNARQLPLTADWWNFPSFAPLMGVTTFTEHLLLAYPVASPIIWATGNPILAFNVVFLLSPVLNAVAANALARQLTGSGAAAFIAGLAFAFAPYQAVHLSHIQTMMAFGMPVALLGLHRYVTSGRRAALLLFAAGWFMTALSNAYTLAFFPVLVALWCVWFVRADWRRLAAIVVTAALTVLPLVPLLWGYRVRHAALGVVRQYDEIRSFSADMVGLAGMFYRVRSWPGLLPHDFEEGALFPGLTTAALAIVAVTAATAALAGPIRQEPAGGARLLRLASPRRLLIAAGVLTLTVLARIWTGYWGWHIGPIPLPPFQPMYLFTVAFTIGLGGALLSDAVRGAWRRRDPSMFYALAVLALFLLALGPEPAWSKPWHGLWWAPYRLLMALPGFDAVRVPARMWLPGVLCLAMAAAFGAAALVQRHRQRQRVLVFLLAAAILYEGYWSDRTVRVPAPMRRGIIPPGAIVLDLPMEQGYVNAVPQYRAVLGGYRTINGYSGFEPSGFDRFRHALADLQRDSVDRYRRMSDLYVIIRPGQDPNVARWLTESAGTEHLFDIDQARIYRMRRLE
jgi:hypothetical protein